MADEFDIEQYLIDNPPDVKDYDTYVEYLDEISYGRATLPIGAFGYAGPYRGEAASKEEAWEVMKSIIITQQTAEPFIEYFKNLAETGFEEQAFDELSQLVGYGIVDLESVVDDVLSEQKQTEFTSFIVNQEIAKQQEVLDTAPGNEQIRELLRSMGFDADNFEDLPAEAKKILLDQINATTQIPGATALAQFYGFNQEEAVFNFDYTGKSMRGGPVYKQGMASSLLASMSENEVADLQSKLIEAGYLSPFSPYTLFDPSDAATQNALAAAMGAHNNRVDGTPILNKSQEYELLSGLVSPGTTDLLVTKLNEELNKDVGKLNQEEKTRLYGVNELSLAAATERADTIAGQVISRDVDMVTAGKLAEVYNNIYREKYEEVVDTALQKMSTGREAELQRIKDIREGKSVPDTRFVGLPASSETESTVPSQEELSQQAATFAKLDFSRRLKDTYFAQEIDDNERRAAIAQASIGFNTALRSLGG